MSSQRLAKSTQKAHCALTQQQGASLDTSWSHFTTDRGPRAQQGLKCTVWHYECHNSSFLTAGWFIRGRQFYFPVSKCRKKKKWREGSSLLRESVRAAERCTFHARILNEENLIIRTGAVEKPHRQSPGARLWAALQSVRSHTEGNTKPLRLRRCLLSQTKPNGAERNMVVTLFFHDITSHRRVTRNVTLMSDFS